MGVGIDNDFEDFLDCCVVGSDSKFIKCVKDYLRSKFTSRAKSLFRRGAGFFRIENNRHLIRLDYRKNRLEQMFILDVTSDDDNAPEWVSFYMLRILSLEERKIDTLEELEDWLSKLGFSKDFISKMSFKLKMRLTEIRFS